MINGVLCLWLLQGVLAVFQGRSLYQLLQGPHNMKRVLLMLVMLYASEAVSMAVLLVVFQGKKLLRFTIHAFWVTLIFPGIATLVADILYIRATGKFLLGMAYLLLAAFMYLVAGVGLSLLLIRIYGHRAFRPQIYRRKTRRKGRAPVVPEPEHKHSSSGEHPTGETASRTYHKGESTSHPKQRREFTSQTNPYSYRKEGPAAGSVIIPDYRQEYIDKVLPEETGLSLVQPTQERPIYYGGTAKQVMVAYISKDNLILQCEEGRYGYQRLGRIASAGRLLEISGRRERPIGTITPAGYVKNAAGLEVGYVDEEGYVFRYEGTGVLDMTHAKTLIGRVNPGDLEAGAALILFYQSIE